MTTPPTTRPTDPKPTDPSPTGARTPPFAGDPRRALGAYGETLAARHLTASGMVLLDRNWRGQSGEIDLVLRDGDVLVICEVKTRSSDACGTPHEAVDQDKLDRLRRLASQWLRAHAVHPRDIRIDLVAVHRPRRGASSLEHVRGLG